MYPLPRFNSYQDFSCQLYLSPFFSLFFSASPQYFEGNPRCYIIYESIIQYIRDTLIYNDNIIIAPDQTNNNFFKIMLLSTAKYFLRSDIFSQPPRQSISWAFALISPLSWNYCLLCTGYHNVSFQVSRGPDCPLPVLQGHTVNYWLMSETPALQLGLYSPKHNLQGN